jgi:hypothetical protein
VTSSSGGSLPSVAGKYLKSVRKVLIIVAHEILLKTCYISISAAEYLLQTTDFQHIKNHLNQYTFSQSVDVHCSTEGIGVCNPADAREVFAQY